MKNYSKRISLASLAICIPILTILAVIKFDVPSMKMGEFLSQNSSASKRRNLEDGEKKINAIWIMVIALAVLTPLVIGLLYLTRN